MDVGHFRSDLGAVHGCHCEQFNASKANPTRLHDSSQDGNGLTKGGNSCSVESAKGNTVLVPPNGRRWRASAVALTGTLAVLALHGHDGSLRRDGY